MSDRNKKKNKETKNPGPGSILKQARNNKKLSVEDVSSRLRLSKAVIEALENDRYDNLPAAIFVRGYLKSYAAFVGVDAQQLIARYEQQAGEAKANISLGAAYVTPPSMAAIQNRKKRMVPLIAGGVLIVLGLIVWLFVDSGDDPAKPIQTASQSAQLEPSVSNALPTPDVAQESAQISEPVGSQPEEAKLAVDEPSMSPAPVAEEPALVATAEQMPTADENQAAPVKQELDQLVLEFNGDSWVDVRDATGKRLIYRMLKSGQQRSVSGVPPFKLTLGNAPEINLTRNGETVDLTPYTRGKVAKFRLGNINE